MIRAAFTMTAVDDIGLDYAGWRPTMAQLHAMLLRPTWVQRYLCKRPSWKAVSRQEIDDLHGAGIGVVLGHEQGAADWMLGRTAGIKAGLVAAQFLADLDAPPGLVVPFAFDTNVPVGDPSAWAYGLAAYEQMASSGYAFGVYGGLPVIRMFASMSQFNWLAGAASWSGAKANSIAVMSRLPGYELVHAHQLGASAGSTSQYDVNRTMRPFAAWLPHDVADPIEHTSPGTPVAITPIPYTPTEDDDMAGNAPLIKMDKRYNEAFLVGAGTPVWLTGEDLAALKGSGVPIVDSGAHPSFEIVARRAGCDTLTPRG